MDLEGVLKMRSLIFVEEFRKTYVHGFLPPVVSKLCVFEEVKLSKFQFPSLKFEHENNSFTALLRGSADDRQLMNGRYILIQPQFYR